MDTCNPNSSDNSKSKRNHTHYIAHKFALSSPLWIGPKVWKISSYGTCVVESVTTNDEWGGHLLDSARKCSYHNPGSLKTIFPLQIKSTQAFWPHKHRATSVGIIFNTDRNCLALKSGIPPWNGVDCKKSSSLGKVGQFTWRWSLCCSAPFPAIKVPLLTILITLVLVSNDEYPKTRTREP